MLVRGYVCFILFEIREPIQAKQTVCGYYHLRVRDQWNLPCHRYPLAANGMMPISPLDLVPNHICWQAIYPTLIITLVCLRSTLDVAIETFQQTTHEWAVRPGTVRGPDDILTAASYPLTTLRIGVQTRTDSSDLDQLDSIRSGVEASSMINDKPRSISYNGLKTDDKFDVT